MPAARYWRLIGFATRGGGDLALGELQLYDTSGRADSAATVTCTATPIAGALSALQDGSAAASCVFAGADVRAPGFVMQWDFSAGVTKDISAIRLGGGTAPAAYPSQFTVQYFDGSAWVTAFTPAGFVWPGAGTLEAAPVLADPLWPQVRALLHLNGANGSTAIINDVVGGAVFTAGGAAQISTAQSDLGGASLYLNGASYVTSTAGSEFDLGVVSASTNFCFEISVRPTSLVGSQVIAGKAIPGSGGSGIGGWLLGQNNGVLFCQVSKNSAAVSPWIYEMRTNAAVLTAGVFQKVSLDIVDGVPVLRVDGVAKAATVTSGGGGWATSIIGFNTSRPEYGLRLGALHTDSMNTSATAYFNGYLDEVRITFAKRHTSDYTPATLEFPQTQYGQAYEAVAVRATRAIGATVAASAHVPPHSTPFAHPLQLARDVEHGGPGTIYGTTKTKGTPNQPTKARVVLLHQRSKLPVRETWSDPVTGAFAFTGIDTTQQFLTLAEDAAGNFRPVAANRLTPEVLP